MSLPDLIIGGITIPRLASLDFSQSYENIGPHTLQRLGDGTGLPQSHGWNKIATSISCSGWAPEGLDGVDWKAAAGVAIACIKPRSIKSASNAITIPAARRTDHGPWGFACVGDELVSSPVSLTGNVATITTVSGASGYLVEWLPLITCFSQNGVRANYDSGGNAYGWTLDAEQL
jgi:hypothetical protein